MERSQMVVNINEGDEGLVRLPPGFRFHPTDEEIVTHYLTPKVLNRTFTAKAIGEADLNKSEPWDLPNKAKMGEKEWFFFCQRDRKYPTGMRTNRATESGYWKATGKDREIFRPVGKLVGMKKTLVFYKGRAPRGEKTNWVMHEFRLEGKLSYFTMSTPPEDEWVVCRVFHKNTGEQQSAVMDNGLNSFVKELLDPPSLPPLMNHSAVNLEPSFASGPSYLFNDQPEILQKEDYKNILVSSYNYSFDTNTYQANPFTSEHQYVGKNLSYLASGSTLHRSNTISLKKEKEVIDQCKVEQYIPTTIQSNKFNVSQSRHVLRTRDYDPDDDLGPSMFSELDSLLEY